MSTFLDVLLIGTLGLLWVSVVFWGTWLVASLILDASRRGAAERAAKRPVTQWRANNPYQQEPPRS